MTTSSTRDGSIPACIEGSGKGNSRQILSFKGFKRPHIPAHRGSGCTDNYSFVHSLILKCIVRNFQNLSAVTAAGFDGSQGVGQGHVHKICRLQYLSLVKIAFLAFVMG